MPHNAITTSIFGPRHHGHHRGEQHKNMHDEQQSIRIELYKASRDDQTWQKLHATPEEAGRQTLPQPLIEAHTYSWPFDADDAQIAGYAKVDANKAQ